MKFPVMKYASLELNRVGFPDNSLVVSQTPLSDEFTAEAPCENGMWVDADKANHEIKLVGEDTVVYGIVYTAEKEWNDHRDGLKHFCQVGGDYPRVGVMQRGDTVTTSCFEVGKVFESEDYPTAKHIIDALRNDLKAGNAQYVVPQVGSGRPLITNEKPTSGFYGKVIDYRTMPNDKDYGVHYYIVAE